MERADRKTLFALFATDLCARTSYGLCRTPLLPLWATMLGASPMQVGVIGAAATLTGLLLKFPAGTLSDVIGRGPLLLVGLLAFAAAPFAYPWIATVAGLVVLRALHGLGTAAYGPVSMAAAAAIAKERRGEVLSWLSNTKIGASLAGAFLGGWILSKDSATGGPPDVAAFHHAWHLAALLGVVALALGVLVLLRSTAVAGAAIKKKGSWAAVGRGLRAAATHRALVVVSSVEGLQNVSVGLLEQFLPLYAVFVAGLSPFAAGALFGVQTLSSVVSKPLFGRWSDRHGRRGLLIAGLWACALPFAAIPFLSNFAALLAAAFVFGVGEALVTSTASALAADVAEGAGLGAAMGAFGTIGDAGHAAGPLFGGAVLAAFGASEGAPDASAAPAFRVCFGLVAGAMAIAAIAVAMSKRDTASKTAS